jgi:hypothetical protein
MGMPQFTVRLVPQSRSLRVKLLPMGETRSIEYRGARLDVTF